MCSIICSATSAWSLTYLTELSSLKCKDNYFQQSLKGAGPTENMGVRDLLDFQTVRKSENLWKEGFVRFYKRYVFYRSVFVLEEKKPPTLQEIPWGQGNTWLSGHFGDVKSSVDIQRARESGSCNVEKPWEVAGPWLGHGATHSPTKQEEMDFNKWTLVQIFLLTMLRSQYCCANQNMKLIEFLYPN